MTTTEPDMARAGKPQNAHELAAEAERIADEQPLIEPAELVDRAPSTEIERAEADGTRAAIDRAAEAALAMPGVPGRDEFLSLAMQARILSMSGAAPPAVRNNPYVAFHVAMVGRDLGISPSAALEQIDIIEGKVDQKTGEKSYQLSLSPQLLNGQIRRLHLGEVVKWRSDAYGCVAMIVGPGGTDRRCMKHRPPEHVEDCRCDVLGYSEFTWEMAERASLVGEGCQPGNHHMKTRTKGDRSWQACGCNQGYITYPERMMWWRCAGFAADDYFPEAGLGLYSPEELGAVVDEEGRPIDPTTVELPEGYQPAALAEPAAPVAPERADPDATWDLQMRIRALPDEQRAKLAERWKDSTKLTYELDDKRHPYRPNELPAASLATAESMVTGFERLAAREGWDADAARAEVEIAVGTTICPYLVPLVILHDPTTPISRGVEAPPGRSDDAQGPESSTEPHSAPSELAPDVEPYDPKNPPSEILEAAIDRAKAIPDDALVDELLAVDQDPVEEGEPGSSPDMRRRRLVLAWLVRQWRPEDIA